MNETTTTDERFFLVARSDGVLVKLQPFRSYEDALTGYHAAADHLRSVEPGTFKAQNYSVRSENDPGLVTRYSERVENYYDPNVVRRALNEAHRKEVGETAMSMIRGAAPGETFHRVVQRAMKSLQDRGYSVRRMDVERAVKDRVILGRCHEHGRSTRAYWAKKSDGPLHRLRCTECGGGLSQTTLALRTDFIRAGVAS